MKCPRCETPTLDEKDREGVVVDVCGQCRGMWLDRGELEKLIARAARDLDELEQRAVPPTAPPRSEPAPPAGYPAAAPPQYGYPAHDRSYDDPRHHAPRARRDSEPDYRHPDPRHRYDDPRYRHKRKKSFIESLGDIFD